MRVPVPSAEVRVDAALVRRLLRAEHPDLADRPLRIAGTGWDTVVYRLGADLSVRVPRRALGAELLERELRWLPELAGRLPLPVPVPVRAGGPTEECPWRWGICRYVPGRPVGAAALEGPAGRRAAEALAEFLAALHVPAPPDAPRSPLRGGPLASRDDRFREGLDALPVHDRERIRAMWQRAVDVPEHSGTPRWLHGDLHGLNVLVRRSRISGIIDFGDLCAGDPATDLACTWLLLDAPARVLLRRELDVDAEAWARGHGWAIFLAVMFLMHSADSPINEAIGLRGIREVLADQPR